MRIDYSAYPTTEDNMNGGAGMSVREHAAITLRIPVSGDEQLDAMIRQANRRDAAVAAMQGMIIRGEDDGPYAADCAIRYADALLARLEEGK